MKSINQFCIVLIVRLLLGSSCAFAQERPIEERLIQKTPEEIFLKRNPTQAKTFFKKQKYLVLDKGGAAKRLRFFIGDKFKFKLHSDNQKYVGEIAAISDSTFTFVVFNEITNRFEYQTFVVKDVKRVYVNRRVPFLTAGAFYFPIAGVGVMGLDVINNKGIDAKWFTSGVVKVGAGLILLGYLGRILSHPTYKINKKHRLKVLQSF